MKKRRAILLTVALLVTTALAQDATITSLDTRLSIIETRVARLEADLSRLSSVPTQLGRIEERLVALTEKSDGLSGSWSSITMAALTGLLGGGIGWLFKSKKG